MSEYKRQELLDLVEELYEDERINLTAYNKLRWAIEEDQEGAVRREDFKQILPIHLENCEKILAVKGKCWKASVRCKECPFSQTNNAKTGNGCWASYSSVLAKHYDSEDKSLIASCEEFLELFRGENNGQR